MPGTKKTDDNIAMIKDLMRQKKAITKQIHDLANKEFHLHRFVEFKKWGAVIWGKIIRQSDGRNFQVQSHTGKEYWIYLYDLVNLWNE